MCLYRMFVPFVVLSIFAAQSSPCRATEDPPPKPKNYLWNDVCTQDDTQDLPFCDTALDIDRRVDDLLRRIPVEAQIQMMANDAPGYDPLYIPPYQWWSEGLHGVVQTSCFANPDKDNKKDTAACATSFPCPSTLATSFNDTLFYKVASTIGKQGRAISNIRASHQGATIGDGLTFWTPVVNMQRDPRWGRNQEVPGEDPLLTSRFAVQYVQGLQQVAWTYNDKQALGASPPLLQVAACCKHWIGNSLEKWHNVTRHDFNAQISLQDLRDYYQRPFWACVHQAGVTGIMCSYNAVNGIPSCVHDELLQQLLRNEWGFTGYITSDCGALQDVHETHHYTSNPIQSAALAVNATVNVNCGDVYSKYLPLALEQGHVAADTITQQFRTLLTVQMKLGLFNQPKNASIYGMLGYSDIDSPEHQQLALEAAEQSIVLLQNNHAASAPSFTGKKQSSSPVLPLSTGQTIAVIGPHVNATTALLSTYRGWRCPSGVDEDCIVTPLAAIAAANTGGTTVSALGCPVDGPPAQIDQARAVAATADVVILLMGLDIHQEDEGLDRVETTLPGYQVDLVQAILELNNPRTVLVLFNGGAIALGDLKDQVPAILQAGYGGQAAAQALARVLFGNYNPSGRLAATMYPPEFVHQIPLTDMGLRNGIGRTHMFYTGPVEFSFGHGLSYSGWSVYYECSYDGRNGQYTLWAIMTNQGPIVGRQSILLLAVRKSQHRNMDEPATRTAQQRLIDYGVTDRILDVGAHDVLSFDLDVSSFSSDEFLVVLEPNGKSRNLGKWKEIMAQTSNDATQTIQRRKMLG